MLHLINSAMMPAGDGVYTSKTISSAEFKRLFSKYKEHEAWKSYLGYPNACRVISELLGEEIVLCRDLTEIKSGDLLLVVKLRYRVNPDEKKTRIHGNNLEDYEFRTVYYFRD